MTAAPPRLDRTGWVLLLSLAFLWSVSFIFIKIAAADFSVLTLVLVRVGLAALVLHAVVLVSRRAYPRRAGEIGRYALMGLVNNVLPFALIVYATPRIGAGAASILNATAPIFALIIAHIATADERITLPKLAGILLGVAGVAALAGPEAVFGAAGNLLPVAAMLGATFFYGVSAVLGRSFRGSDPRVSAACQLTASTLLLAPVALAFDQPWATPLPGVEALWAAAGLALFSTALAYVVFFALISRAGATNTVLVTLLIPVGGIVLAWLLLGESFGPGEVAGMLCIGLGLAVIDGRALALFGCRPPKVRPRSAP